MSADHRTDFPRYLQSLCNDDKYRDWQEIYTPTDALDGQPVQQPKSRHRLNLALKVRTVEPQDQQRQASEKFEPMQVLEGLRKYQDKHVLLVGRPGSGKSTALKRLLWEEAQQAQTNPKAKIPVLVELRQYKISLLDLIQCFLQRYELLLDLEEIKTLLLQGRFLLLLDGVNELPTVALRDLEAFEQNYRTTPMIFTSRDVGKSLNISKTLEMQPLTPTQMEQFVCTYLPESGDHMLGQLGNRLQELGQTPLLLLMLCKVFDRLGRVPTNLGQAFRAFAEIYDNELKANVPTYQESEYWWSRLLKHLAFKMLQGNSLTEPRWTISKQEAERILREFLQDKVAYPDNCAIRWLEDLLKYHLIQRGTNNGIEFRHQLIQEYYAAEYLWEKLSELSDERLKWEYLNYFKWMEPLALMLALVDNKAEAVRVVNLALDVDLRLGARLAGAVQPELQAQTVGLVVDQPIPQILKIYLLGLTRSDKAIPALVQAVVDEDTTDEASGVKVLVAEALQYIGSEAAISALSCKDLLLQPDSTVEKEPLDWELQDQFHNKLFSIVLDKLNGDLQQTKKFLSAYCRTLADYLANGYEWLTLPNQSIITADHPLAPSSETKMYDKSSGVSIYYLLGLLGSSELLPCLFEILLTETSNTRKVMLPIVMIQTRCQYYNHELHAIATSPPPQEENNTNEPLADTTTVYIEQVKIDYGNASIGAVNIDSTIYGNQIGIQHNK